MPGTRSLASIRNEMSRSGLRDTHSAASEAMRERLTPGMMRFARFPAKFYPTVD